MLHPTSQKKCIIKVFERKETNTGEERGKVNFFGFPVGKGHAFSVIQAIFQ